MRSVCKNDLPLLDCKNNLPDPLTYGSLMKFGAIEKIQEFEKKIKKETESVCVICLESLTNEGSNDSPIKFIFQLKSCHHAFHVLGAKSIMDQTQSEDYFICPICKTVTGIRVGNQPEGKMTVTKRLNPCY